ncbi:MAG: hypothetical protein DI538_31705, partial [Azospira oryzae]
MVSRQPEPDQARAALLALAARALSGMVLGVGALMLLAWLVELPGVMHSQFTGYRGDMGVALLVLGAATELLRRHGQPMAAALLAMVGTMGSLVFMAYISGTGVHAVALAAGALLVTVAGGVAGSGAAALLTLLYIASVLLLAMLERQGLLPQGGAMPSVNDRVIVHVLVALSALIGALLLHRILGTALRRAMNEEQRLARLVQAAHNWDWEADAQFRFTHLSDQFEALTGLSREEFLRLGQPGGPQIVEDADYPALMEDIRALRPYRDHINCFRSVDGQLSWALSSGEPVFDEDGQH